MNSEVSSRLRELHSTIDAGEPQSHSCISLKVPRSPGPTADATPIAFHTACRELHGNTDLLCRGSSWRSAWPSLLRTHAAVHVRARCRPVARVLDHGQTLLWHMWLQDYPEHRLQFFNLLHAITKHCFATLFTMSPTQLKLVIDSIIWCAFSCPPVESQVHMHGLL